MESLNETMVEIKKNGDLYHIRIPGRRDGELVGAIQNLVL